MFKSTYIVALAVLAVSNYGTLASPIVQPSVIHHHHHHHHHNTSRAVRPTPTVQATTTHEAALAEATQKNLKRDAGNVPGGNTELTASKDYSKTIMPPAKTAKKSTNDIQNTARLFSHGAMQAGANFRDGAIATGSQILGAGANMFSGGANEGALNV
ncbi:hypothetical protein JR316_0007832 [Psilocybe cubensis]|uniref:Uncharacterized protein n=2 Tax=Psilocybe cubensis TaxID=181762 RepID=A0A8H7XRP3_PSICU|nr:hypothetical protein JR316_0007832 [Psilocybe cubensis]KAH9479244.1 hypothetical protein JR316_0007832 [Psilocybe cubensis]